MTKTMIDADQLITYLEMNDDAHPIDRIDLILLIAATLNDADPTNDATMRAADDFILSYDLCPIHQCDIEICADDDEPECADLRN